jgi:hypothetical protein
VAAGVLPLQLTRAPRPLCNVCLRVPPTTHRPLQFAERPEHGQELWDLAVELTGLGKTDDTLDA